MPDSLRLSQLLNFAFYLDGMRHRVVGEGVVGYGPVFCSVVIVLFSYLRWLMFTFLSKPDAQMAKADGTWRGSLGGEWSVLVFQYPS